MMGLSDYFDRLLEIGTGWLGWTEQQTLATRITTIVLAHTGKIEMLSFAFGASPGPASEPEPTLPAASAILNVFRAAAGPNGRK